MNDKEKNYIIACMELNTILNLLPQKDKEKIPQNFLNEIKKYKLKNYVFKYDYSKSLDEQNLNDVTREMLYVIYRDYLCDDKKMLEEKVNKLIGEMSIFNAEKINLSEFIKRLNK